MTTKTLSYSDEDADLNKALKQLRVPMSLLQAADWQQAGSASLRSSDGVNLPNLALVEKQRRGLYCTAKPKRKTTEQTTVEEANAILENLTNF